jgi:hypothetical protein
LQYLGPAVANAIRNAAGKPVGLLCTKACAHSGTATICALSKNRQSD